MKATGIVRNIDELGRIVLPKELRRTLGISEGDPIEIFVDEDAIILKRFDSVGDIEQVIDRAKKALLTKGATVPPEQLNALLDKLAEMRAIIKSGQK